MTSASISELKSNPNAVIAASLDYPVAIQNRNKTKAYLVGKDIYESLIRYLEDVEDKKAIDSIDLDDKRDFEEFAKELGI